MKAVISANSKGGTGKTLVAINLAYELAKHGKVGILDADLDSSNLYEYLDLEGKLSLDKERRMVPIEHDGMKVFTMGGFLPDSTKGVSLTGSSVNQMLHDAVKNVKWGGLDFLVIDAPAGTGKDSFLALRDALGENLVGIVITTQPNILDDVRRLYDLCARHRIRILGLIENMKGVVCSEGHALACPICSGGDEEFVPLHNGVEALCEEMGIDYLGFIPLSRRIRDQPRLPRWAISPVEKAVEKVIKVEITKKGIMKKVLQWMK